MELQALAPNLGASFEGSRGIGGAKSYRGGRRRCPYQLCPSTCSTPIVRSSPAIFAPAGSGEMAPPTLPSILNTASLTALRAGLASPCLATQFSKSNQGARAPGTRRAPSMAPMTAMLCHPASWTSILHRVRRMCISNTLVISPKRSCRK